MRCGFFHSFMVFCIWTSVRKTSFFFTQQDEELPSGDSSSHFNSVCCIEKGSDKEELFRLSVTHPGKEGYMAPGESSAAENRRARSVDGFISRLLHFFLHFCYETGGSVSTGYGS